MLRKVTRWARERARVRGQSAARRDAIEKRVCGQRVYNYIIYALNADQMCPIARTTQCVVQYMVCIKCVCVAKAHILYAAYV